MWKLSFKNISFKNKIIAVILLVSFLTQIVGAIIYIIFDKKEYEQNTIRELFIMGDIIANNSIAPLLFNDPNEASKVLTSLSTNPFIKMTSIYTENKKPFATVENQPSIKCPTPVFF
ncbi:MAG: hypothetical protein GYA62_05280, partial [Bacteroidales bacterium]|nr:hypothetical protein [Bacteroidales bacterium]